MHHQDLVGTLELAEKCHELALSAVNSSLVDWFQSAVPKNSEQALSTRWRSVFASCKRRLASAPPIAMAADGFDDLLDLSDRRDRVGLARMSLLINALHYIPAQQGPAWLHTLYLRSSADEQQTLLRSLPLLAHGALYIETAREGCRGNRTDVFSAIALRNSYPKQYFDQAAFNQMVLKAIFNNIAIDRIEGLEQRYNPELRRMAEDFRAERLAAGRGVSENLLYLCQYSSS